MQQILDEIAGKVPDLTSEERRELIRLLQEEENKENRNGRKGYVSPNTIWIKEHRAEYAGKYVALEDGKLVGTGKNYPEALTDARKNGAEKPMITYLFPLDEVPFGGW